MSGRQQKEEIKRILKRIYKKYQRFSDNTFYYELEGESLNYIQMKSPEDYSLILDKLLDSRLAYGVYIGSVRNIQPSRRCLKGSEIGDLVAQFIPESTIGVNETLDQFIAYITGVDYTMGIRDPLSQVFTYRRLLSRSGHWPHHVYICSHVYNVIPYDPDPSSIFNGRKGVVAYCFSLRNIAGAKPKYMDIINAYQQLKTNWFLAAGSAPRISGIPCGFVYYTKEAIRGEIKSAKMVMKQYGIIRVAFPLR